MSPLTARERRRHFHADEVGFHATMDGRLLLVSNRLPVTRRRIEGRTTLVPSSGGLVAGLAPLHEQPDCLWFGNLGGGKPDDVARELAQKRLVPIPLPEEQERRYYEGFSNQVLWPLSHYFIESIRLDRRDFDAYRAVNERFADAIAAHARPDDRIWVHDYQLMLLPALLRQRLPRARIGYFHHIPFPSSEVFMILPFAAELLRGLMGADLVGLHTYDYARHLVTSYRRILGIEFDESWVAAEDGGCRVGVFPLGVDAAGLRERAARPQVGRRVEFWRQRMLSRKVVLGVDRLDYTKGLPLRLRAYRRLLELYPEWREDAVYLQIAVPSRTTIGSYQALKDEVERLVGEINGALAVEGKVPILYLYRSVPPDELSALYRLADVCLVTPLRDGMNLVAKEYVASRLEDSGVLVLSQFAGAACEMGEALRVNPWDLDGTAEAIHRALTMTEAEQRQRMGALRRRVDRSDARRWGQRFLEALGTTPRARPTAEADGRWQKALADAFARAHRVLVALDYDGTLVELAPTPERAVPTPEVRALVASLARLPRVEVVLISGRERETLAAWLGDLDVHLVAEHGFFLRLRGKRTFEELRPPRRDWMPAVRQVMEDYVARTPGSFVEEKTAALAWHYRQVEPAFGMWQARELANHLAEAFANVPIQVIHGARVVEVRPQGVHKGTALSELLERRGPFDLIVAAGDDRTDEDLFASLPESAWSIKVGRGPTRARYRLGSPRELRALLEDLLQARAHAAPWEAPAPSP